MDFVLSPDGFLTTPHDRWRCAVGRAGIGIKTQEGDGITPLGQFGLGRVFWRPDRTKHPETSLPVQPITPNMGWCDDPNHKDYNTLVKLPHPANHEKMYRKDGLYDILVEILFNTNPIISGQGSAIFMHVAKPQYQPTEGCIALEINDLQNLLRFANEKSRLII